MADFSAKKNAGKPLIAKLKGKVIKPRGGGGGGAAAASEEDDQDGSFKVCIF